MESRDDLGVVSLGQDLRLSIGHLARRLRQIHASADLADEIPFTELALLSRLERVGPATPGALAKTEHISPQAIGTVLGALSLRGLVTREPDPLDGRRVVFTITDAGRLVLAGRSQFVSERLAQALADGFSVDELRTIRAALPLLDRLAARV